MNRKEPKEIFEVLSRYVHVKYGEMDVAYVIHVGGSMVECERIPIDDYVQALSENRIHDMMDAFSNNANYHILFIIGYFTPMIMSIVVRRETYINSIVDILCKGTIPVILESDYDMIVFLKNFHKLLEKEEKKQMKL